MVRLDRPGSRGQDSQGSALPVDNAVRLVREWCKPALNAAGSGFVEHLDVLLDRCPGGRPV